MEPLAKRKHDIDITTIRKLDAGDVQHIDDALYKVAKQIVIAKDKHKAIIMMIGGHVIRSGTQKYIIDLMQRGYITCIAMNGSCIIHDYELARIGATTESVATYIKDGRFGLWRETGEINDIINEAYRSDNSIGMGKAIGDHIAKSDFPHRDVSILAAAARLGVPATVHVGIGYDIIHEHPNCDGAATGALSYNDFLLFASAIQNLEGGVIMNFGSAVMAPEVYLKALSMARNVARQEGKTIHDFTTLVCDLYDLPPTYATEPPQSTTWYYFRPWKTMLVRTVAEGGESHYVKGRHEQTIPALWKAITDIAKQ